MDERRGHRAPWWLVLLTILAFLTVVSIQHFGVIDKGHAPADHAEAVAVGRTVSSSSPSPVAILTKMAMGMRDWAKADPASAGQLTKSFTQMLDDQARGQPSATERLHAAIGVAELEGPEAGIKRLDWLQGREPYLVPQGFEAMFGAPEVPPPVESGSVISRDVEVLRGLWQDPATESGTNRIESLIERYMSPDADFIVDEAAGVDGLRGRHGFFGDLAATLGDEAAPARKDAQADGKGLVLVLMLAGGYFVLAFIVGLGLLIVLSIMIGNGRLKRRFEVDPVIVEEAGTPPSRTAWLETVCVFLLGFLTTSVGSSLLMGGAGRLPLALGLQGALALVIFWPLVRGYSLRRWCREIGLFGSRARGYDGQPGSGGGGVYGVVREVMMGLAFYYAGIPLLVLTAFFAVLAMLVQQYVMKRFFGVEPVMPTNDIGELLGGQSVWMMMGVFALAVVWAPIVEEAIFRGALYRHLRSKAKGWSVGASVVLTACAFSLMHGYPLAGLIIVGFLGALFAVMREFRGSLIPSITAHFLHNFSVLTLMLVLLRLAS